MLTHPTEQRIEYWPIDRLVAYARNPRRNNATVNRMRGSILTKLTTMTLVGQLRRLGGNVL